MIKNRAFMLGLGIGLVVGAILLQLMMMGERSALSAQPEDKKWTKEDIEKAAKSLDLQVVEDQSELMTEEQWKDKLKKDGGIMTGEPVEPPSKASDAQKPETPKSPDNPESADTNKKAESPVVKKPKDPEPAQVGFVISKGSNMGDVAEGLKAAGVITDKQAFIKAATEQKITSHIQTGVYTFTVGESFKSIFKKISEKPSGNL